LIKVARYRTICDAHECEAVIVTNEYSFTSSACHAYCNACGIKLINIQHGENFYCIRSSFFHFDACYVWTKEYGNIFTALRAEPAQFIAAVPPSLRFAERYKIDKKIDYTYYLANESISCMKKIYGALLELKRQGALVHVRAHPRYSDLKQVEQLFRDIPIEDFRTIPIEESVLQSRHVIALYSAVLQQAYFNDVPIIIDDVSNPGKYKKLFERNYLLLKEEHMLLSELLEKGILE